MNTGQLLWSEPRTATVEAALTDKGLYRSMYDPHNAKWVASHDGVTIKADCWSRDEAEAECLAHYMRSIGWGAAPQEQRSFASFDGPAAPEPRRRGRPRLHRSH